MKIPKGLSKEGKEIFWQSWLEGRLSVIFKKLRQNDVSDKELSEYLNGLNRGYVYSIRRYGIKRWNGVTIRRKAENLNGKSCKGCGEVKDGTGNIHLHHIGNPKDHRPENLMPLCRSCHRKVHAGTFTK